jgi:hypothetical protein
MTSAPTERSPAPFVVGFGRSGTTLLRLMLDAHPALAVPPETAFLPRLIRACLAGASPAEALALLREQPRWGDLGLDEDEVLARFGDAPRLDAGHAARTIYSLYAERQGKPRWGDKTPSYFRRMKLIEDALPEARFVHVIRDGRDAALSFRRVPQHMRARPTETIAEEAARWARTIRKARRQGRRVRHYLEVRFEELVRDPEAALRRVCEFCELDFAPEMLNYHERSAERLREIERPMTLATGRRVDPADRVRIFGLTSEPPRAERLEVWRREMSPEDQVAFEREAGKVLARLGYPLAGEGP